MVGCEGLAKFIHGLTGIGRFLFCFKEEWYFIQCYATLFLRILAEVHEIETTL